MKSESTAHRWAVILAGGEGTRLRPLTRHLAGDDRPKQFCKVIGDETLLNQTRSRVAKTIETEQTLLVLSAAHERYYAGQVAGVPSSGLVIQPEDRGTAAAIVYSLMRIRAMDAGAFVAYFPSDHYFANDGALECHLEEAFAAARKRRDRVALLGIVAESPETAYGWIETGVQLATPPPARVLEVTRFWEKPSDVQAEVLLGRGCLWNSFVMIGSIEAYFDLIGRTIPDLLAPFEAIRGTFQTPAEGGAVRDVYTRLPAANFSRQVLAASPSSLMAVRGCNLGWTDLGEPNRVLAVQRHNRAERGLKNGFPLPEPVAGKSLL
jgi:mannose-1-phosphate guanylyltransferase